MDLTKSDEDEPCDEPLYQYYTIVNDDTTETNNDKPIIYLTFEQNEIESEVELTENIVFAQDDTVATDGSSFKVLSFDSDGIFVANNEENLVAVKPDLISKDVSIVSNMNEIIGNAAENDNRLKIQLQNGASAIITKKIWSSLIENVNEKLQEKKPRKKHPCMYLGCNKVYSSAQHLTVHIRSHTGIKPYHCTVESCEKSFTKRYSLKAHLRTHTGEKPYACSICVKKFKTSGDLQKHIRTHTGEKPFNCPIEGCGRSFTTSNIRKIHVRSHTGERPYVCPKSMCGKAFASATNYKNHMRIHSGEKPYICSVPGCDKRFTEYSSLYKHNIVHKPYKPFKCNYCGQLCKQENTLKAHKRTIHGMVIMQDGTEVIVKKEEPAEVIYEVYNPVEDYNPEESEGE